MATHSCVLVWEISWSEEPGRLQSMGSQRVRHDLVIFFFKFANAHLNCKALRSHHVSLIDQR